MKFSLRAQGSHVAIDITDLIGMGGYYATDLRDALRATKDVKSITVRLSSDGGEILEGLAIYNMLKAHPAKVRVEVIGVAASMGSIIAMAGDEIAMAENSFMMIHNPAGGADGESSDLRETADVLDKMRDMLANIYAKRTGQDIDQIKASMSAETWMTASEALEAGYATEIIPAKSMVAVSRRFKKTPNALRRAKPRAAMRTKLQTLIALRGKALTKKLRALESDDLAQLATALGLEDSASMEDVVGAIKALQEAVRASDDEEEKEKEGDDGDEEKEKDENDDGEKEEPSKDESDDDDDEKEEKEEKSAAQARRIIGERVSARLDRIERKIDREKRERLIAANPRKFTPATEKLARNWDTKTLRDFVRNAPDVSEAPDSEPTGGTRGPRALKTEITLTDEEKRICKLTGKDPKVLLDFKKSQDEKRKAG